MQVTREGVAVGILKFICQAAGVQQVAKTEQDALVDQRFEHLVATAADSAQIVERDRCASRESVVGASDKGDVAWVERSQIVICLHADPRAGVAALVQPVIDQTGMAAYRHALPGCLQVSLSGDGVLVVAEVIANVG
jgi:hypothetical protein